MMKEALGVCVRQIGEKVARISNCKACLSTFRRIGDAMNSKFQLGLLFENQWVSSVLG